MDASGATALYTPNDQFFLEARRFDCVGTYGRKAACLFAIPLATAFWRHVASDKRISADFRAIAGERVEKIQPLQENFARLGESLAHGFRYPR